MKLNNFTACEFVPKSIYNLRGEKAVQLMDKEVLVFIDKLRDVLGKRITINDWKWGGQFSQRGLRTSESRYFKPFSQHTFGKALDFDVEGMTAKEVRKWIIEHCELEWIKPITFIEDGVSWVHIDTRPTIGDRLVVWNVRTGDSKCYR